MNIYHVEQEENDDFDDYTDFVCAAETEQDARMTQPNGKQEPFQADDEGFLLELDVAQSRARGVEVRTRTRKSGCWAYRAAAVRVTLIGVAAPGTVAGVICAAHHPVVRMARLDRVTP